MLFTVGSVFYYWGSSSVPKQPDVMNRLLTANGSKGRFVLPDSTVVWLNSNSLLEYPETFSSSAVKSVYPVKPILRYGGMRSFLSVCKPER